MENIKRRKFVINKDNKKAGVSTISYVTDPAIEVDFKFLEKVKEIKKFQTLNEEKHICVGPILIPNIEILRIDNFTGEYYYGIFDCDIVKFVSEKYMKDKNTDSVNLEHSLRVNDITLVESWIIEDSKMDKSCLYNFDLNVGTWMGIFKVENQEVWDEYIKTGILKGFSVEILCDTQIINEDEDEDEDEIIDDKLSNLINKIFDILNEK